jgi:pyruvate kinase
MPIQRTSQAPLRTSASTTAKAISTPATDKPVGTAALDSVVVDKLAPPSMQQLDHLWDTGQYAAIVKAIAATVAPLTRTDFKGLDGQALVVTASKLFVLEERLKATINKLSLTDNKTAKLHALTLAQDIASASTSVFRQAVVLQDAADPQPVSAWLVAKDTHKNAHKWTPEEHLTYLAQKTVEFYLKGGSDAQIANVSPAFLRSVKSGALCEYVVDAYDMARAAVVEPGRPSPGHTVLSRGNDAFTAGTFEVQKNDHGDITHVLIGTFSGHYRTGLEAQGHMVRHVVTALSAMYPKRSKKEILAMVVQREGQATNPRTIEVISRGIGLDGALAQQLETNLKAEAMRWQPLQIVQTPKQPGSPLANELAGIKDWASGALKNNLFIDAAHRPVSSEAPAAGAARSALEVLARIDAFMGKAAQANNAVVGDQLLGTLRALDSYTGKLPADIVDSKVQKEIDRLLKRWNNGVFGVTGADLGAVFSIPPTGRSTRIVATINPKATDDELKDILRAGADVARFNTAHGSVGDKITVMKKLRQFAAQMGREVSIQVDLEGPKLRLRSFENPKQLANNDIFLKPGELATLTTADVKGSQSAMLFPVDYPTMCDDVKPGDPVSMNDGTVKLVVKTVDKAAGRVTAEVVMGGKVWDNKGVAFPQSKLSGATVTDEDLQNLMALIDHVDVFAQSFVQSADDVVFLRQRMQDLGAVKPIIAKVERGNIALDESALTRIALVSDALMVARGDLGVELGEAQLPVAERLIREVGETTGRPVMLATEVMMSVLNESRGSRGDVDALYGAVVDRRFHAIMLGKETSSHKQPGNVVREIAGYIIFGETEREKPRDKKQAESLTSTTAASLFMNRGRVAAPPRGT